MVNDASKPDSAIVAKQQAATLQTYSDEEARSVIRFLSAEGRTPRIYIHETAALQGDKCMCKAIYHWVRYGHNMLTTTPTALGKNTSW